LATNRNGGKRALNATYDDYDDDDLINESTNQNKFTRCRILPTKILSFFLTLQLSKK